MAINTAIMLRIEGWQSLVHKDIEAGGSNAADSAAKVVSR